MRWNDEEATRIQLGPRQEANNTNCYIDGKDELWLAPGLCIIEGINGQCEYG